MGSDLVLAKPEEWVDVQEIRRRRPATTRVPSAESLAALCAGRSVLISNRMEKIWVQVTHIQVEANPFQSLYTARIEDFPMSYDTYGYDHGSHVQFRGCHICTYRR
jgi:hypothetical protein